MDWSVEADDAAQVVLRRWRTRRQETHFQATIERMTMKITEKPLQDIQETLTTDRCSISGMRWRSSAAIVLALSLVATLSWAGTVHDVGSLLDDPGSYQSQVVRVTGTVYNHKIRRGTNKCLQL